MAFRVTARTSEILNFSTQKLPARHIAAAADRILQLLGYYYKREVDGHTNGF